MREVFSIIRWSLLTWGLQVFWANEFPNISIFWSLDELFCQRQQLKISLVSDKRWNSQRILWVQTVRPGQIIHRDDVFRVAECQYFYVFHVDSLAAFNFDVTAKLSGENPFYARSHWFRQLAENRDHILIICCGEDVNVVNIFDLLEKGLQLRSNNEPFAAAEENEGLIKIQKQDFLTTIGNDPVCLHFWLDSPLQPCLLHGLELIGWRMFGEGRESENYLFLGLLWQHNGNLLIMRKRIFEVLVGEVKKAEEQFFQKLHLWIKKV